MPEKIRIYNANSNDIVYPETTYDQVKGGEANTVLGYDENGEPTLINKDELGGGGETDGGSKLYLHQIVFRATSTPLYNYTYFNIYVISKRSNVVTNYSDAVRVINGTVSEYPPLNRLAGEAINPINTLPYVSTAASASLQTISQSGPSSFTIVAIINGELKSASGYEFYQDFVTEY